MRNLNFTPFPELNTERLYLRQLKKEDKHEIFLLRSDNTVNKYLDRDPARTLKDAEDFIEKISRSIEAGQSIYWAIEFKKTGKLIGTTGLWNFVTQDSKAEIGFELLPAYQGRGFMQEALSRVIGFAFLVLKLDSIEAYTHPGNPASISLLEKHNFRKVKTEEMLIFSLQRSMDM